MDFQELILSRRSIRKYQNREIERSELRKILEAAMAAPSAVAKDPWYFYAVSNRDILQGMADVLPYGKMLRDAGASLVVCGLPEEANRGEIGYMVQDCSAAVENILLSAHGLGIGAVWLGVYPNEDRMEGMVRLLDIPGNMIPLAVVSLGYPAESPAPRTRYSDSRVTWKD